MEELTRGNMVCKFGSLKNLFSVLARKLQLGNWTSVYIMFPKMHAIAQAHTGIHASKFTGVIYCTCKIIAFSLLFYYISCREEFFIEHYIHEIYNAINYKIL